MTKADRSVIIATSTEGMEQKKMSNVISWRTKKTAEGFEFRVIEVGYQVETKVLKTGVLPTRARAVTQAKKWVRYLKAQQKKVA